jgi:hypothetical protein
VAQNAPLEVHIMTTKSAFSSVKLPESLVSEAKQAAAPMRRSVAGQIEYWATLGRIAEETGLTTLQAREAIAQYDIGHQRRANHSLQSIEDAFLKAEQAGTLAQAVRKTVLSNRRKSAQVA